MNTLRSLLVVTLGAGAVLTLLAVLQPREPVQAKPGVSTTILLHEVEYDPPGCGDTPCEWFELYNVTGQVITLSNWTIFDANSSDVIPTLVISPLQFVVVAASSSFMTNYPSYTGTIVYVPGGTIGNGLANTTDCLTLADNTGAIVDRLAYGSNSCGFEFNLPDVSEGHSLERQPIGIDTDTANDWINRNPPTPGYGINPLPPVPLTPPGSILISAVHSGVSTGGLGDEGFRLTNVSTQPITLTDWAVMKDPGSDKVNLTGTLQPQQSIWIAKTAITFTQQFGFKPAYKYTPDADLSVPALTVNGLPALGDSGKLALREGITNVIDVVIWGSTALTDAQWISPTVQRYSDGDVSAIGQILYRKLDEATGKIVTDTNTARDWANDRADPISGRKTQFPGWDLENFWRTARVTGTATLTVAIAPDNAYRVISDVLSSAQSSIVMEMHTFDNLGLLNVMTQTLSRGVSVTILLEGDPVGGIDDQERWACQQIEKAGGQCWFMINEPDPHIFDRYDYLHVKMIVVDNRVVAIGSENLSPRSLTYDNPADGTVGHRGVYLVTDASGVVSRAREIWHADFDPINHRDILRWSPHLTGSYGPPKVGFTPDYNIEVGGYRIRYPTPLAVTAPLTFELLTAPESDLRATDSLLGLINRAGAGDTIDVEQLVEPPHWGDSASNAIEDPNLRLEALIAAAGRGAKVRVLLDRYFDVPTGTMSNSATARYIESLRSISPTLRANLAARLGDPARYGIHNKMFVLNLDGKKWVHAGSLNGTETSNKANREVALQVESGAAYDYLRAMFEYDWAFQPRVRLPLVLNNYIAPPNHLLISKVFYLGSTSLVTGSEWVQLYNPTAITVSLTGYKLGDQAVPGATGFTVDGMWQFPSSAIITPGAMLNVAITSQGYFSKYGRYSDYVFFGGTPGVNQMVPYLSYTPNISFSLANTGDEVLLLGPSDQLIDGVAWGTSALPKHIACVAIDPNLYPLGNPSIKREPLWKDTDSCPADFVIDTTAIP